MKRDDVDTFEKLMAQLQSLHSELTMLAKKAPNGTLNTFKLRLVNSTLDRSNKFLGEKYRPFLDFELFSEEAMPSNSDATFIVSQYIECAEKFRSDNIHFQYGDWYWKVDDTYEDEDEDGEDSSMRTAPPRKLGK